jgi:hypothetical protein
MDTLTCHSPWNSAPYIPEIGYHLPPESLAIPTEIGYNVPQELHVINPPKFEAIRPHTQLPFTPRII